jgi:tripartite-type tricarboxylate transporter receptor subunit TctC
MNGWFAIFTSAGVPENIILKLNQAINDIARAADYQDFVAGKGYETMITTPAELAQLVKTEVIKWGEVIRGIPESVNKN